MKYRKGNLNDIDNIMTIIEDGRLFLSFQNSGQWQDGYPNKETIIQDINEGHLYVVLTKDDNIAGVASFTYYEEDYDHLYEGKWLSSFPYIVMHRIATKKEYYGQGYGNQLFILFEMIAKKEGYHSLRIDTHKNNEVMLYLIKKNHYTYCGKAILKPHKDRLVFEKLI